MKIEKNELDIETKEIAESLLFNGNGFIGIRNTFDEKKYNDYTSNRHTYVSGFFDMYSINYPEKFFGATTQGEQMIPVIDGQTSYIYIGEERFDMDSCIVNKHTRYLDIQEGVSVREVNFTTESGKNTIMRIEKIASFTNKQYVATKYIFDKVNHDDDIKIITEISFIPYSDIDKNDPRVSHNTYELNILNNDIENKTVEFSASKSNIKCYFGWNISKIDGIDSDDKCIKVTSHIKNELIKTYTYSLENYIIPTISFGKLKSEQKSYLENFWDINKIKIDAVDDLEQSINYGTFALLQSIGENSISAKGLSGIGYEGHIFWDAEMYILPQFIKTNPEVAREMLMYRVNMLDNAIKNRQMVGYKRGALYPWRTISGRESSAFFEAGMAQHHINVDISFALFKYIEFTGDTSILLEGGFKMIHEIARFFDDIIYLKNDKYHIDKVTGPDEYTALVNDNVYTNMLVGYHFKKMIEIYKVNTELLNNINIYLDNETVDRYIHISENMAIHMNEDCSILAQDRDFLNKAYWPYENNSSKPLLLEYHPIQIYRYQISKQADAVLALQLLGFDIFDREFIRNTIKYYDDITTHDSSLSYSNFATVYARLGEAKAYEYFKKNARLDLDNLHHNTKDGIHTASMGGTYQTLIEGFADIKIIDNKLVAKNNLPKEINNIEFNINFKNKMYTILIEKGEEPFISERKS